MTRADLIKPKGAFFGLQREESRLRLDERRGSIGHWPDLRLLKPQRAFVAALREESPLGLDERRRKGCA